MENRIAITAFAALAQETRLTVFRLMVRVGPSGLTAGEIAEQLGVPASTLSFHLGTLERARLLRSWRIQKNIYYATDFDGTRDLIDFLMTDCCGGKPELCGVAPLAADGRPAGCAPTGCN
ncbi:MAG TPA: metalloregulator ArsR/SmtB family transcription factor [Azospirillaceae bacterium]|nr:metalloregulator ArsR/SmtB family transcription factor [Azospirillaceae bacterium]